MFHLRKEKGPATDASIGLLFVLFGVYYLASGHEFCVGTGPGGSCLLGTTGFSGFFILLGLVFVGSALKGYTGERLEPF